MGVHSFLPEKNGYGLWKVSIQKVAIVQKVKEWVGLEWVELESRAVDKYFRRCVFSKTIVVQ